MPYFYNCLVVSINFLQMYSKFLNYLTFCLLKNIKPFFTASQILSRLMTMATRSTIPIINMHLTLAGKFLYQEISRFIMTLLFLCGHQRPLRVPVFPGADSGPSRQFPEHRHIRQLCGRWTG